MRRPTLPVDDDGWDILAANIVKANLTLANMSMLDLEREMKRMGIAQSQKNISAKLGRGTFSAAWFLQVLAATGVEQLDLPSVDDGARSDRGRASD